jgi:sarcosine oxidase delta subunit
MLFCPYCLRRKKPSDGEGDFTDVAGFYLTDDVNKKKFTLKIHAQGCGRVFIAVSDVKRGEYVACFKIPQQAWVRAILYRPQV